MSETELLKRWCEALNWSKSDGDTLGHWRSKQPGNRLIWNTRWNCATGVIYPQDLMPIEKMSIQQVLLEVEENLYNDNGTVAADAGRLLHRYGQKKKDKYQWEISAKKYLGDTRRHAPAYEAFWDPTPPDKLIIKGHYRPQWGPEPEPAPEPEEVKPGMPTWEEQHPGQEYVKPKRLHRNYFGNKPEYKGELGEVQ